MYYRALLYVLPLPLVVYIWNSGNVEIDVTAKTLLSVILLLLTVGGYIEMYQDGLEVGDDE